MATHSSTLAWRIPGTGEPGGCRLWDHTESDTTEVTQQQQQQLNYIDYEQSKWIKICSEILAYKTKENNLKFKKTRTQVFYCLMFFNDYAKKALGTNNFVKYIKVNKNLDSFMNLFTGRP